MRTPCASTIVAKLLPALASHGGTAGIPLHPILALGTLLELGSLCKFDEGLIVLVETVVDPVLLASHPHVIVAATSQAVVLLAGRTAVVVQGLVEFKHCLASSSGTPRGRSVVLLYELVKGKFLVFLSKLAIYITVNLAGFEAMLAPFHRTSNLYLICLYLGLQVTIDALGMKYMSALEYSEESTIDLRAANRAFPPLRFSFFCFFFSFSFFLLHKLLEGEFVLLILFVYPLLFLPLIINVFSISHDFSQVILNDAQESFVELLLRPRLIQAFVLYGVNDDEYNILRADQFTHLHFLKCFEVFSQLDNGAVCEGDAGCCEGVAEQKIYWVEGFVSLQDSKQIFSELQLLF